MSPRLKELNDNPYYIENVDDMNSDGIENWLLSTYSVSNALIESKSIKDRKKKTEILYIFFGIHTANAVHLAERLAELKETKTA